MKLGNIIQLFCKFAVEDKLHGGLADDMPDKDFDQDQIDKGIVVEREHVGNNDDEVAKEIAKDHLMEIADYYDRLENMEEDAKQEEKADDYEPCGMCGFDHDYEYEEAFAWHKDDILGEPTVLGTTHEYKNDIKINEKESGKFEVFQGGEFLGNAKNLQEAENIAMKYVYLK